MFVWWGERGESKSTMIQEGRGSGDLCLFGGRGRSVLFIPHMHSSIQPPIPRQQGRTLVCTIHQPSFKIFQLFDRLVLLSLGAVTYAGPVARVEAYFHTLGYDTPHGDNPGERCGWAGG